MKGLLKTVARNITLDLIYETVEERTRELKEDIRDIRQEMGQLRQEVKSNSDQLRQEINHLNSRFDQLFTAILNLYEKTVKDK